MKKLIITIMVISILFTAGFSKMLKSPKEVYRVYLKGESIGLIKSKEKLEKYIDTKEAEIKEKYKVKKVYAPTDLDIVKEVTYYDNVSSVKKIYNKIKDISPFTINGYKITIKGIDSKDSNGKTIKGKNQTIYVLDKEVFREAANTTAQAFIGKSVYESFANDTQKEIEETDFPIKA